MTPEEFLITFVNWFNSTVADSDVSPLSKDEAYVVWFNYTLGNSKVLISTTRPDHKYYEMTYHSDKDCVYVDTYLKVRHDTEKVTKA